MFTNKFESTNLENNNTYYSAQTMQENMNYTVGTWKQNAGT